MEERYFEDEIDLREYISVLFKHWYWIVGLAVVAALVAGLISVFLLSPTYEAQALVAVTQQRYTLQFDPRFETTDIEPAYNAFPTLATSDALIQEVLAEVGPALPDDDATLSGLRNIMSASTAGDPSLIRLHVESTDPALATQIVNTWAELFVVKANELYGENTGQVTALEEQLAAAKEDRDAAEQALIDFQARNHTSTLQAQLDSLQEGYKSLLDEQHEIERIVQDIHGLRAQLATLPDDQPVAFNDELTALSLQVQAFNADSSTMQLQFDSAQSLSGKTAGELRASLDELIANIEAKSGEIETRLAPIESEVLNLQQRVQEVEAENAQLTDQLELTRETYTTLSRKVEEARIASQVSRGEVSLASAAAIPEKPSGPRTLINVAVAGMLGLMFGVFAAFFIEYWHQPQEEQTVTREESPAGRRGGLDDPVTQKAQS